MYNYASSWNLSNLIATCTSTPLTSLSYSPPATQTHTHGQTIWSFPQVMFSSMRETSQILVSQKTLKNSSTFWTASLINTRYEWMFCTLQLKGSEAKWSNPRPPWLYPPETKMISKSVSRAGENSVIWKFEHFCRRGYTIFFHFLGISGHSTHLIVG